MWPEANTCRIRGPIRQLPCTTEALGDQAEHDGKSRSTPVMERGTSPIELTFPNLVDNNRRAKMAQLPNEVIALEIS